MDYKKIIEEILEVYKINASEFAEKVDVQRSSISHILSGRNKPSLDFFIKVKDEFPELRWDYILLGQKPMTISEKNMIQKAEQIDEPEESNSSSPTLFDAIKTKPMEEKEIIIEKKEVKHISKIVWFYSDNTFEIFEN